MADPTAVSADPPPLSTDDYDSCLPIPPFDAAFFSQTLNDSDIHNNDDFTIDDFILDFDFDDFSLPSADEDDEFLNPTDQIPLFDAPSSSESRQDSGGRVDGVEGLDFKNSENIGGGGDAKVLNYPSPESRGSGNWGSDISGDIIIIRNKCVAGSVSSSSPNSSNCSIRIGAVDQEIKEEKPPRKNGNDGSSLKRKKGCEDLPNSEKRKSFDSENTSSNSERVSGEDEKRKARLIRNRESAQLSRQRKKHYVEELEDKVRAMSSTIQDLNAKISYFMAENVTLRQQMGGAGAAPPPPIAPPPPPGIYPHPAMMYPWMQFPPPYFVKPQGSQVPLVPIPRLKPQKPAQEPNVSKKPKIKKVAGVSFLGVLFFIMLFGGLVPMVNMRYGGFREAFTGAESYVGSEMHEKHQGRVLMVNGTEKYVDRRDFGRKSSVHCGQRDHYSGGKPNSDAFVGMSNGTELLVASLYVPRNDKLVKIDGNLIIHSVLASEKAKLSHGKEGGETGLAVPGDLGPAIPVLGEQRNGGRHPHVKALGSGSAKDSIIPKTTDGGLQQWFREGLAGPMLSTGMCTEVFQFDVSSASGAIIPATNTTATRNISEEQNQNSMPLGNGRNRRILRSLPIPLPESSHNLSKRHTGRNSPKENGNNSSSPMVVSVLVDPRETGDANVDGVMGKKSVSRIFVVVLIDSVKYVTYSCVLPFKGSTPHLVTT